MQRGEELPAADVRLVTWAMRLGSIPAVLKHLPVILETAFEAFKPFGQAIEFPHLLVEVALIDGMGLIEPLH